MSGLVSRRVRNLQALAAQPPWALVFLGAAVDVRLVDQGINWVAVVTAAITLLAVLVALLGPTWRSRWSAPTLSLSGDPTVRLTLDLGKRVPKWPFSSTTRPTRTGLRTWKRS